MSVTVIVSLKVEDFDSGTLHFLARVAAVKKPAFMQKDTEI